MACVGFEKGGWLLGGLLCACAIAVSQQLPVPAAQLEARGQIVVAGQSMPYLIRRLPVSSFPELPEGVAEALNRQGCMIPQSYGAHHPENVVHASLERAGSSDWAVLCSTQGRVSLLVIFASGPSQGQPFVVASALETERLQMHDVSGVLGFNWGIDPASPDQVRQAQSGMEKKPPPVDHDALADSILDRRTVYRFYAKSTWVVLAIPE